MAHRPEVAGRLRTILDGRRPRRGVTRRGLTLAAVAAIALLAPLATIRPVAFLRLRSNSTPMLQWMLPCPPRLRR